MTMTVETGTKRRSTAALTDQYELTMVQAALASGMGQHRAVFELFARKLPVGRRYGVVAGLGRAIEAVQDFRFEPELVEHLRRNRIVDDATAGWLADYRFTGNVDAYREGELYFPNSPVLTVEATFAEAVLLETVLLSVLNHDSAIASAAARMKSVAGERTLMEMGSRRTHEDAAVSAARVAYICGFDATSNLEAGYRYGIPTRGTSAHAFTLGHAITGHGTGFTDQDAAEKAAFAAQVRSLGVGTTLLVDTFDTAQGIRNAVEVAGTELGAIRIDSGELAEEARKARTLLDSLGAHRTRIVITSDLDEYAIAELASEPVDGYGVGTRLVQGSGHPTASMVFKLVAIASEEGSRAPLYPVAKKASGKASYGGRKTAWRLYDDSGEASTELVTTSLASESQGRALQVPVIRGGEVVHTPSLEEIRAHHRAAIAELPAEALELGAGTPAIPTVLGQN